MQTIRVGVTDIVSISRISENRQYPQLSVLLLTIIPSDITYIGYEPAGLTVHPPPQNDREWVHFFRIGV